MNLTDSQCLVAGNCLELELGSRSGVCRMWNEDFEIERFGLRSRDDLAARTRDGGLWNLDVAGLSAIAS